MRVGQSARVSRISVVQVAGIICATPTTSSLIHPAIVCLAAPVSVRWRLTLAFAVLYPLRSRHYNDIPLGVGAKVYITPDSSYLTCHLPHVVVCIPIPCMALFYAGVGVLCEGIVCSILSLCADGGVRCEDTCLMQIFQLFRCIHLRAQDMLCL